MRLSITLDPDLHQIASARARARRVSLSTEINTLLRAAVSPPPLPAFPASSPIADPDPAQHTLDPLTGLLVSHGRRRFQVSPGKPGLTLADFQRMEDDDDLRHLENLPKT